MLSVNKQNKLPLRKPVPFIGNHTKQLDLGVNLIPQGESIVYFSDFHSNISKLPLIAGLMDTIKKQLDGQPLFKVCAGDFLFGKTTKNSNLVISILNKMGLDYLTLGNHEFDMPASLLKILIKILKMPVLVANFDNSKVQLPIKDCDIKIVNGEPLATIGVTTNSTSKKHREGQMNIEETIQTVQQKIDQLTAKGIKKIMILSHLGIENDTKMAQETSGIDIIISSHDHYAINGIKEGLNLIKSQSNKPVAIFQAAQDNDFLGYARVKFDKNGFLTKVFNKTISSANPLINKNEQINQVIQDNIFSKPIAYSVNCISTNEANYSENKLANWLTDSIKIELSKAQIVLLPSRMIRTSLPKGKITTLSIDEILPNRNDNEIESYVILKVSGQKLYNIINKINRLADSPYGRTLTHVSGMRYSINKQLEAYDLKLVDDSKKSINIKNEEYYNVAIPGYIVNSHKFKDLNLSENEVIEKTHKTTSDIIIDYLNKYSSIINPELDGRIKLDVKIISRYNNKKLPNYIDLSNNI